METRAMIPPHVFAAMDSLNIAELSALREDELRPLLPSLVRMSLCSPLDQGKVWTRKRRSILRLLCGVETVNSLVALLSIDFHVLEQDAKKELALRGKVGGATQLKDSNLMISGGNGGASSGGGSSALEFERSEAVGKLRLVLSEILFVMSKLRAAAVEAAFGGGDVASTTPSVAGEFYWRNSELFEDGIYLEEVSDVLCIAQAELPNLLQITELSDTLLHVPNGDWLICRLVANNADAFHEVCHSLVAGGRAPASSPTGDSVDDDVDTRKRCDVLRALIAMNPRQALSIRAMAVNDGKLPELAIALTLEHRLGATDGITPSSSISTAVSSDSSLPSVLVLSNDLLEFSSGLLLNGDVNSRSGWFAQFVRNDQKKKSGAHQDSFSSQMVKKFRTDLLSQLSLILRPTAKEAEIGEEEKASTTTHSKSISVVHIEDDDRLTAANDFVRLYCALKAASIKFTEEESVSLVTLLTSRPKTSALGTRFISLSLSMIIACPGLFSSPDDDKRVSAWLQWLMNEAPRFESGDGGGGGEESGGEGGGFGEMLLLIAIHFHGNQMTAISDLVCATLGMKVPVRSNSLVRLKAIFTQDIFSEKVVTSLAVSVPVTRGLSAAIPGFLSVHCIHQLLKSRAFAKHKVPIKDWICRQLRECRGPLHPVVPPLVEAFVNSTLIPSRQAAQNTNEPITQQEVLSFFASSPLLLNKQTTDNMETDSDEAMDAEERVVPQILVLYYLLLYEDVRMSQIKAITSGSRQFLNYSSELWDELPIKYLLRLAHRHQQNYAGLYASLLRLVANHFPHLCLVDDWLTEEEDSTNQRLRDATASINAAALPGLPTWTSTLSPATLQRAFDACFESKIWTSLTVMLTRLSTKDSCEMIAFAETLTSNLCRLLPVQSVDGAIESQPPRKVLDIVNAVWLKLSSVMPRHLHVMTVNGLRSSRLRPYPTSSSTTLSTLSNLEPLLNQSDIITDPLTVLRCDERVFRSPPLLDITLHILNACLHASKAMLAKHIRVYPSVVPSENARVSVNGVVSAPEGPSDAERDELRFALVAAQDSAAVQILLEWCLTLPSEESEPLLSSLREVQCLVCSWLHQMFIADPTLAKLVHFQGYPLQLLRVTVAGVPSMHICIDFIPELLRQPQIEKQVFAIQLVSYLSLQYPLPRTLSVARLCINVMATLLTVLPRHQRIPFFLITTPSLSRISRAFPPLADDVTSLLLQLGRIANASTSKCSYMAAGLTSPDDESSFKSDDVDSDKTSSKPVALASTMKVEDRRNAFSTLDSAEVGLMDVVKEVFVDVVSVAALLKQS